MGIKNWTVTAASIKSARAREIYLHDKNHKNHKNTEEYIDVFGSESHTLNIIRACENYKLQTAKKGRGGRPPTEAMEFVFTFPKMVVPDKSQWRKLFESVMTNTAEHLGVTPKQISPTIRAVAHQQNQDPAMRGSGCHMHVVVGKFTQDGQYLRDLQKKGVLHTMKQSFNKAVLDVMGVDHKSYTPDKPYTGVAKKRAPQWKVEAGREFDEVAAQRALVEQAQLDLVEREAVLAAGTERNNKNHKTLIAFRDKLVDADKKITKKHNTTVELSKTFEKFITQANKWLEAFADENLKQQNRQFNRMNKTIGELNAFAVSEEDERFIQSLETMANKVNSKSNKPLNPINTTSTKPKGIKL